MDYNELTAEGNIIAETANRDVRNSAIFVQRNTWHHISYEHLSLTKSYTPNQKMCPVKHRRLAIKIEI